MRKNNFPINSTKSVQDTDLGMRFGFIGGGKEEVKVAKSFKPNNTLSKEETKHEIEHLDDLILNDDELEISVRNGDIGKNHVEEENGIEDPPIKQDKDVIDYNALISQSEESVIPARASEEVKAKVDDQLAKTRLEQLKKLKEQKTQKRWGSALMHFGIDPKKYLNGVDNIMSVYPFDEFNFVLAKQGKYSKKKMAQVIIEVCRFEVINDTYNVECKDITGITMQGTFHLNCKDKLKKKMKKGTVMVLKNVIISNMTNIYLLIDGLREII